MAARLEIRLESRRGERRRTSGSFAHGEKRQRDRRAVDESDQLRELGWVFFSAAHRHATPLPSRTATAPEQAPGTNDDELVIEGSLASASLCAPCIAMTGNIPFF